MKRKYTLAEIESQLRKAAQATGLGWGLAEEAGKAARWLAAYNLPGPELMLSCLQQVDAESYRAHFPNCSADHWQAGTEWLCPIASGAALSDRSHRMIDGVEFSLALCAYPLLLVAILGQAARAQQTAFIASWAGVQFTCFEDGIAVEGHRADLLRARADWVHCRRSVATSPMLKQKPSFLAFALASDVWEAIDELASRTYAPATEQSRAGAGAGLTDND